MAFLQRKKTPRLSPGTCLLLQTRHGSALRPRSRTLQGEARESARGHARPSTALQGVPTARREEPSRGTRGPAPSATRPGRRRGPQGSGEAARPRTEPHVPPGGQPFPARGAPRPAPAPSSLPAAPPQRPPSGRRRGRAEESPRRLGSSPPAPGAPATIGPRAGGNRGHPHPGAAAGSAARRSAPYCGGGGGGKGGAAAAARAGPGHPPLSAPA